MKHKTKRLLTETIAGFLPLIALAGCTKAEARSSSEDVNSVFSYREIYLPETSGENAADFHLNNVDHDWGVWGHNLDNILPEKKSESIFAKRNGTVTHDQFCFTSPRLYEYIEEYIDKRYDETDQIRFAILPNDNGIVCMCNRCVEIGNKKNDASPAVLHIIKKLAERFPNHRFYTSHYLTTRGVPAEKMPENTGVLISAMDFPLSPVETAQEKEFMRLIQTWKQKTDHILIWDYINNFDDYFTPFPVLDIMQRRLQNYHDNGVTGVFLNGSGADYSSFSMLKGDVLAELTIDPSNDWKEILKRKALERYPVTGATIADFMIAQEEYVKTKGKQLPLYEGVLKSLDTYLPKDEFIKFYDELRALRPRTEGEERKYVDRLCGALALTRLELNRMDGSTENSKEYLNDLKSLKDYEIPIYSESHWTVDRYVRDYEKMLDHYDKYGQKNLLKGKKLIPLTPLDQEYSDISIITDGMLGIPSNYHSGNLIMSPSDYSQIAIPPVDGLKKLRVCLVYNPAYRIDIPVEVSLTTTGGKKIESVTPTYPADSSGHAFVEFNVPSNAGSLVVELIKDPEIHSMAIDEIEGYK